MNVFVGAKKIFSTFVLRFYFRGTFRMEREDGYTFDCRIPPFSLESKPDGGSATPPETI